MKKSKICFFHHLPNIPDLTLINTTPKPNSFNSIINSFSVQGAHHEALLTFFSMLRSGTAPDAYTFPSTLKACASLELSQHGLLLHQRAIVSGYASDSYVASSLINFYAKFGESCRARRVFDMMSERNVVPWTAIIGCYSRSGDVSVAISMYNWMRRGGVQPTSVTVLGMLSGVSEHANLECLHACSVRYGFDSYVPLLNSFLNVYCKCGRVNDARKLFEFMEFRRDIVSWNTLIAGYAETGHVKEIWWLLSRMRTDGIEPDQQTFGASVSAIATQSNLKLGMLVHGHILTVGLNLDAHTVTSLIVMYLKCGNTNAAFKLFGQTPAKDVVLWTAMISGLVQNDCADKALAVFRWMMSSGQQPSTATIASALASCAQTRSYDEGTSIHGYTLRCDKFLDAPVHNSLITMYAKCGHLEQSCAVFDRMPEKDVVSWNSVVAGHAENGQLFKALCLFNEMRSIQRPDSVTLISLFQACASTGALHLGKCVHNIAIKSFVGPCVLVNTALVDMYCKSGALGSAQKCFDRMPQPDVVSWSTLIAGYGSHGRGETALMKYKEFLQTGIKPNDVIFLAVLSACNHNGLVSQGLGLYESMRHDFGIEPRLEHHACVVDLLARAGRVHEAYSFFKRTCPEPTVDVLGILLDACRTTKNAELGDVIAREILMLKPVSAENFVQLAHSYASMNRWDGVEQAWVQMKSLGLKKLPGWSFIELQGAITTFFNDHTSHPQYEDITCILILLGSEMRIMDIYLESCWSLPIIETG